MEADIRIPRYLDYVKDYPHVFVNDNAQNSIQVITDEAVIREKQDWLYEEAKRKNEPLHWYDLGVVAEDRWVIVLRDLVRFPNGKYGPYIRTINRASVLLKKATDVVVLPIVDGNVLLIKHFRHDDRSWHWEIPRGFGEEGLSPEDNARKELTEETDLHITKIIRLDADSMDGRTSSIAYFAAYATGPVAIEHDEGIDTYRLCTFDEISQMVLSCEIDDMFTSRALVLALLRGIYTPGVVPVLP